MEKVTIVGAGLAGCEAALQLAARGVPVRLIEMRPAKSTPAHHTAEPAELVCSNSLKSLDPCSAAGAFKFELAAMGSFLIRIAVEHAIPAGKALAVDRDAFSRAVKEALEGNDGIELVCEEQVSIPDAPAIIATGPLTSDPLADAIRVELGVDHLSFFDAAAPIVMADSLDRSKVFAQSRYGKGGGDDYLNAPFERDEYEAFVSELVGAERAIGKEFERKELFSACQPVEEIARTGMDALRFGPLKPVGLTDPSTGRRPWAVVQLRAEDASLTSYNLVGFQTNLKHGEQLRVFRMIPGFEHAEFARYGVMHRNTFVDSPHALSGLFELPGRPGVRLAGQLTGTEGYCEAIASGLLSALATYAAIKGQELPALPESTLFGALVAYATNPETKGYQPMHVNYGIIPPLEAKVKGKRLRYAAYAARAREEALSFRSALDAAGLAGEAIPADIPFAIARYVEEDADDR